MSLRFWLRRVRTAFLRLPLLAPVYVHSGGYTSFPCLDPSACIHLPVLFSWLLPVLHVSFHQGRAHVLPRVRKGPWSTI